MKNYPLFAATLSLVLLAGCAPKTDEKPKTETPAAGAKASAGTPVRVAAATEKEVVRAVSVTGSIAATDSVDLAAKVSARVSFIAAREGEAVRKGQLVAQQDASDYETQVRTPKDSAIAYTRIIAGRTV